MGTQHDDHHDNRTQTPATETAADDTTLALIEEQADRTIRRLFRDGRWFFSVVDVIGLLTDSVSPGAYWRKLKQRLKEDEGAHETVTKCHTLRMTAADGKQRLTDAADTETLLRIIQSVPSPKAEPVKQWLARLGARRLEEVNRPLDPAQARAEATTLTKPALDAPALIWADYHEQLAVLYRRQAAYEAQLAYVDAKREEHDDQIGELHDRLESVEEVSRLIPEILERLGPQTLTPAHQATMKAMVKRLHDLTGEAFPAIYADLYDHFHVAKYSDVPDAQWPEVAAWFQARIVAGERRRGR